MLLLLLLLLLLGEVVRLVTPGAVLRTAETERRPNDLIAMVTGLKDKSLGIDGKGGNPRTPKNWLLLYLLGGDGYLLPSLLAWVQQLTVSSLCPHCRKTRRRPPAVLIHFKISKYGNMAHSAVTTHPQS
jgi:hypothetical protein